MVNKIVVTTSDSDQSSVSTSGLILTIDKARNRFPQPIDISGMLDKFGEGSKFFSWQKKIKL